MKTTTTKKGGAPVPVLRRHKRSRRAYARFNGRDVGFGPWTDGGKNGKPEPETRAAYDAYVARWLANGRESEEAPDEGISVAEVVAAWRRHLEAKHADWGPQSWDRIAPATDALAKLYGAEPAAEFGPRKLETVRASMIAGGKLCRGEINSRVQVVRRCFRWAVAKELVPATVIHALDAVDHLRAGEFGVREGRERTAVDEPTIWATLDYLNPVTAAVVELLWWTGARPSEVLNLRPRDVDRGGDVWVAKLERHKTAKHGRARELDFGPKAQAVLRHFLDRVPPPAADAPLFSPKLAMALHHHRLRAERKTPVWASHRRRYEREAAKREAADYGDRYTATTLRHAVERAVRRANEDRREAGEDPLPRWTPYQLRHAALTRVRTARGLEAAKAVGGHSAAGITEVYSRAAERELARRVAGELG